MIRPNVERTCRALFACLLSAAMLTSLPASAEDSAEGLLSKALEFYSGQTTSTSDLEKIRDVLDQIVAEHPSSDLAVSIILQEPVGGIDVIDMDNRLAQSVTGEAQISEPNPTLECINAALTAPPQQLLVLDLEIGASGQVLNIPNLRVPEAPDAAARADFFAVVTALDSCAPFSANLVDQRVELQIGLDGEASVQPISDGDSTNQSETQTQLVSESEVRIVATKDTEAALRLDKKKIRETQARLLLSGNNPKGVDGVLGNGTRGAIRAWQAQKGMVETGYLSESLLQILQSETSATYPVWFKEQQAAKVKAQQRKPQESGSRLPKGWYRDREGKDCRKVQFGLTMCRPYPP